ncbi:MAG: hypothetical protein M9890_02645 [Thermomicrobiales bacterium]|nr:hypothetical protein [Thermomicrobiales bacterium]
MSSSILASTTARRPSTVTAAIVLLVIAGVGGFLASLFVYDDFGAGFLVVAGVMAIVRLIAATGMLNHHRWGYIIGAVITVLDVLLTVPLFFDDPSTSLQVIGAIALVINAVTLVLLALPASRRNFATA